MKTFKDRLKEIREEKRISQEQIAVELGLHRSNYSKIENGHQKMTHEQLALFCQFMDVSADYVLGIEVNNKTTYTIDKAKEFELKMHEMVDNFINKK